MCMCPKRKNTLYNVITLDKPRAAYMNAAVYMCMRPKHKRKLYYIIILLYKPCSAYTNANVYVRVSQTPTQIILIYRPFSRGVSCKINKIHHKQIGETQAARPCGCRLIPASCAPCPAASPAKPNKNPEHVQRE